MKHAELREAEAEAELETATKRTDVNAAAQRLLHAKEALKAAGQERAATRPAAARAAGAGAS